MPLSNDLWLVDAYYIDRDHLGQIRIVGPQNHLHYGSQGLYGDDIIIKDVAPRDSSVQLQLAINPPDGFLPDPAIGHIRRVRDYIQLIGRPDRSFAEVAETHPGALSPSRITTEATDEGLVISYLRTYGPHYYGVRLQLPPDALARRDDDRHGFWIDHPMPLTISLETQASEVPAPYTGPLLRPEVKLPLKNLSPERRDEAKHILERTAAELDHLIRHGKTSGFDYGTIFPRDWMETADLIADELTPSALRYMYAESLRHVNPDGTGWHEDIIGEFKYERDEELNHLNRSLHALIDPEDPLATQFRHVMTQLDELFISRQMIDIEPRYILGLRVIPFEDFDADSQDRLRRVADYIINQAESNDLITFKRLGLTQRRYRGHDYYSVGNWRDGLRAYKQVHPVIAPFDVNAVFYPQALQLIGQHHRVLGIPADRIKPLIAKWNRVPDWFRFTNADGLPAFALALYDVKHEHGRTDFQMLRVNHLDEASYLFYAEPTEAEAVSFATRILSPDYFYTSSGPILVGRNQGYDHTYYHGEVIWAKQAAFAVCGLERAAALGAKQGWPAASLQTIHQAILTTADATLRAFRDLGVIPELHYDDNGRPRSYADQAEPEAQVNYVQLWSAAGARRIVRAFINETAHSAPSRTATAAPNAPASPK